MNDMNQSLLQTLKNTGLEVICPHKDTIDVGDSDCQCWICLDCGEKLEFGVVKNCPTCGRKMDQKDLEVFEYLGECMLCDSVGSDQ